MQLYSPDSNEKPVNNKQPNFVAKKERPKKLLFLLTKWLFIVRTCNEWLEKALNKNRKNLT